MHPRLPISLLLVSLLVPVAHGHFLVLTPSVDILGASSSRTVSLDIAFTHPMASGPAMEMGIPAQFGVMVGGTKSDLRDALAARVIDGKRAYNAAYPVQQPGVHVFYIEPAPYYEPGEATTIIHYTKVVVEAFGAGSGWDALVGFPVEIRPLTRPYGLWTGNVFQGVVLKDGQPVPFAQVEVEYLNKDGKIEVPSAAYETQALKSDANGTFTYGLPRAGWWGFAALIDGGKRTAPDGKESDTELGGLIWVHARDME